MWKKMISLVCIVFSFLTLFIPSGRITSQPDVNTWVYALSSTDTSYEVSRVNTTDGKSEQLFSITSQSQDSFATVLPKTEVDMARAYLAANGFKDQNLNTALASKLDVTVQSMSVAPSNQEVALNVKYQKCFNPQELVCFGTSQIVLAVSKKVLWSLGFHTPQYAPKGCMVPPTPSPIYLDFYLDVKDVLWTRDEKAVVVSLSGSNPYCFGSDANWPLVVVPLTSGAQAFGIGEARVWAVAADSRTVGAIVRNCQPRCRESVQIIRFDPATQRLSTSDYPLDQYTQVAHEAGMAYVKGMLVFDAFDIPKLEGGGLVVFNPNRQPRLSISPRAAQGTKTIRSLSNNDAAIIEGRDNSLWEATVEGNSVQARQIIKGPISSWRVGRNRTLLVQFKDDPMYSIIDAQGKTLGKIDVAAKVRSLRQNANVKTISIDW